MGTEGTWGGDGGDTSTGSTRWPGNPPYREWGRLRAVPAHSLRWSHPAHTLVSDVGPPDRGRRFCCRSPSEWRFVFCNPSKLIHSHLPEGQGQAQECLGTSGKRSPLNYKRPLRLPAAELPWSYPSHEAVMSAAHSWWGGGGSDSVETRGLSAQDTGCSITIGARPRQASSWTQLWLPLAPAASHGSDLRYGHKHSLSADRQARTARNHCPWERFSTRESWWATSRRPG